MDLRDNWKFRHTGSAYGRVLWWDAYRWMMSDDRSYLTACASICDVLGIDHDWLKLSLRRWIARRVLNDEGKKGGTAATTAA